MEIVVDKSFQGERKASHARFCCGHWLGVQKHQEGWEAEAEAEGGEQQGETVRTQVIGVRR